jgi:hypothetical protein
MFLFPVWAFHFSFFVSPDLCEHVLVWAVFVVPPPLGRSLVCLPSPAHVCVCVRSVFAAHVFSCGTTWVLLEKLNLIFALCGVAVRFSVHLIKLLWCRPGRCLIVSVWICPRQKSLFACSICSSSCFPVMPLGRLFPNLGSLRSVQCSCAWGSWGGADLLCASQFILQEFSAWFVLWSSAACFVSRAGTWFRFLPSTCAAWFLLMESPRPALSSPRCSLLVQFLVPVARSKGFAHSGSEQLGSCVLACTAAWPVHGWSWVHSLEALALISFFLRHMLWVCFPSSCVQCAITILDYRQGFSRSISHVKVPVFLALLVDLLGSCGVLAPWFFICLLLLDSRGKFFVFVLSHWFKLS